MPCFHPIAGWQARQGAKLTLLGPYSPAKHAGREDIIPLGCQQCLGCKSSYAQMWALRSQHECSLHEHNCFITLTYNDEHLPEEGHLSSDDLTKFWKRLRRSLGASKNGNRGGILETPWLGNRDAPIKYLASGEYGGRRGRPHYHALLYNLDFADRVICGKDIWNSPTLNAIWADQDGNPMGTARVAPATYGRALYIAKYTIKDLRSTARWEITNHETGECRPAPFLRASNGIGRRWLEKYYEDLEQGFCLQNGQKKAIPRYYKKWMDANRGYFLALLKANAEKERLKATDAADPNRLRDGEIIAEQAQAINRQRKFLAEL